jgi:hypothetical protein
VGIVTKNQAEQLFQNLYAGLAMALRGKTVMIVVDDGKECPRDGRPSRAFASIEAIVGGNDIAPIGERIDQQFQTLLP